MKIINLTQHLATPEQVAQGVVDLPTEEHLRLKALLTFEKLPDEYFIRERAQAIAALAKRHMKVGDSVMIGGVPFFMAALANALKTEGIKPLFAFSKRRVEEKMLPDGSVEKRMVFRHEGFVPYVR